MFNGFSEKSGAFLLELAFNNERPWFLAHRQKFEEHVHTPFKALAAESYRLMTARFPDFECSVHISRIYRDARRLFGRGPYKDHLWFTLTDSRVLHEGPSFWFELDPGACGFGMGFWGATPAQMAAYRRGIDANPARFRRLAQTVEELGWTPGGESYKRPRGLRGDPLLDGWYNRRWVSADKSLPLGGVVFTDALPALLVGEWAGLMPLYQFLMEVYLACPEEDRPR